MNTSKHRAAFRLFGRRSRQWGCLELSDPRKKRGVRHPLELLLTLVWLSALTACRTTRDMEARAMRWLGRPISDTRLSTFLPQLSVEELESTLQTQIRDMNRSKCLEPNLGVPFSVVAIDGKTIWVGLDEANGFCQQQAPTHPGGKEHYLFRVCRAVVTSSRVHACIWQKPIPAHTNEMGVFRSMWNDLMKHYGRTELVQVVTTDAGYTSIENADLVCDSGRHYVMALKGTQATLLEEAQRLLPTWTETRRGDIVMNPPEAETAEKRNGKLVERKLWRTAEMAAFLDWHHLGEVWLVRQKSTTLETGKVSVEDRYFLTSFELGTLTGQQALALVRAHWHIENDGNWVMDTVMKEDDYPWVARGNGLLVCSLIRLMAFNVLQLLRNRTLRSESSRAMSWRELIALAHEAIVLALSGLLSPNQVAPNEVLLAQT